MYNNNNNYNRRGAGECCNKLNAEQLGGKHQARTTQANHTQHVPKQLMQKSTQTCLHRTQPEPPKQRIHPPKQKQQNQQHIPAAGSPSAAYMLCGRCRCQLNSLDYVPSGHQMHPLPPRSYATMPQPQPNSAGGDSMLYLNSNGNNETSETLMPCGKETVRRKESLSPLESARENCQQTSARFSAKYDENNSPRIEPESTGSESANTVNTVKTVTSITVKSADHLRSVVRSQIQMQELLRQSIGQVTEITEKLVMTTDPLLLVSSKGRSVSSTTFDMPHKTYPPLAGENNKQALILTARDIMDTKVMAPMKRRVQRFYLSNLREEMKILDDMERAPDLIDEVYESFKELLGPSL
ncbi:GH10354 [Drosophila grimshawi]|uniref:GH10354 n=1 Tax=Drosophila grimshawi TaxID=7222 RepID=B4JA37_DROGR|nr:GH10354 [Drosophila grimshawi]